MINLLKKQILFLLIVVSFSAHAVTLKKTIINLDAPWGMTWLNDNHLLIT